MAEAPADVVEPETPAAENDAATAIVARVRRRLFLGSDGGLPDKASEPVARSVRFVEAHFSRQIALDDMAAAAGISKFYFSREFKAQTGVAPGAFLRGYRVVRAMEELLNSTGAIGDIAAAAGYQSAAAFSRAFRKVTGSTPYLFRMTRLARADERGLRSARTGAPQPGDGEQEHAAHPAAPSAIFSQ